MVVKNRAGKETLSVASPYEQTFKTRYRRVGRPADDREPLFAREGADPVLALIAKRRAYAVVHEEQRARLAEVFDRELKVLARRGVEIAAQDAGVKLPEATEVAGAEMG